MDLTSEVLRELVRYDAASGHFYWEERSPKWFTRPADCASWNRVHAGRQILPKTDGHGYTNLKIGFLGARRTITIHRLVWLFHYGRLPVGQIDHINGIRSDNGIENLREVSVAENAKNQATPKNNTSGVAGVCRDGRGWRAQIGRGEKYLGYFPTFEAAVAARREAERRLGYHENHGRRPSVYARPG